jgi:hypothetical protein
MHLGLGLWLLLAVLRWGDWGNFRHYYPTMVYVTTCKLLYELIAHESFYLWRLQPDFGTNFLEVVILHAFFIYPFSAFLFLSNYPKEWCKQIFHYLKWMFIYASLEWIGWKYGKITYHNGWNFGWSLLFLVNMFVLIRIHFVSYLWAVLFTVLSTLFYMFLFNII